ncbi:MAG: PD-(D/E)XK nuclease family protein [Candidatus Gastranaerophilales bacterium]|nr:PD-(D/E)XK nuclease family protein [Candidatus Gastranaerophilales bacterium]
MIIHILNKTDILKYYADIPEDIFENIASIKKITDESRSFQRKFPSGNLADFLNYLDTSLKQEIPLEIEDSNIIKNAVQLVTCHKSKGREFSYVFLYNLISKKWEKAPSRDNLKIPVEKATFSDDPEEARDAEVGRLLFVAMTRAKYALYLTHSIMINGKNEELSKFISHISDHDELVNKHIYELKPDEIAQEYINQFILPEIYVCDSYLEELKERAKRHAMSATSLNDYAACPRKFLYAHIYRIPDFEYISPALAFGTAVHEAFEKFTKVALEQRSYPSKEALVTYFMDNLDIQPFETPEKREHSILKGRNLFDGYYDRFITIPIDNVISAELDLRNISVGNYLVKGKIDRIEKTGDSYTVIDFKTGKTKSLKSIQEGNHADYMDQLRFYKLLYESQYPDRKVNKALLIFVEEPKTHEFVLIQDDLEIIKDKIITTFNKIHKLEFDACDMHKQGADGCKFCNYKLLCKLNTV